MILAASVRLMSRGAVGVLSAVSSDIVFEIQQRWPDATPTVAAWIVLMVALALVVWVQFDEVRSGEGGLRVSSTVSRAISVFDRIGRPAYSVYLRNRRTREAIEGQMRPIIFDLWRPGPLMLGLHTPVGFYTGFFVDAHRIRFDNAGVLRGRLPSFVARPRPSGSRMRNC